MPPPLVLYRVAQLPLDDQGVHSWQEHLQTPPVACRCPRLRKAEGQRLCRGHPWHLVSSPSLRHRGRGTADDLGPACIQHTPATAYQNED
eukprot:87713-Alexandrium_andersonii.AAC.1